MVTGGVLAGEVGAPVRRLRGLLDAATAGDLSQRGESTRRDELGDLLRRFDAMAQALDEILAATASEASGLAAAAEELTDSTGRSGRGESRPPSTPVP